MSDFCIEIHQLFNGLKRYHFPFSAEKIPKNGIYILFEKGEYAHGGDRVVRVGTHTGVDQLKCRLLQHFMNENKDRSIFRKNIGRALLHMNNDPYLRIWEYDTTSKKDKEKYSHLIDKKHQSELEKQVTHIIQNNFSFAVIEENEKDNRLYIESKIISEVSNCHGCQAGINWFGNYSTKEKICESGLWQVNQLYKKGFSTREFEDFRKRFIYT